MRLTTMTSLRCLRYFLLLLLLQFLHPPTTTSVPGIVRFEFVSFSPFDQSAAELAVIEQDRAAATALADASEADQHALEFINAQLKIAMSACVCACIFLLHVRFLLVQLVGLCVVQRKILRLHLSFCGKNVSWRIASLREPSTRRHR